MGADDERGDRVRVREVVEAYAAGVDALDTSGVAALFAPDGSLALPDPDRPGAWLELTGPAAIEARLEGLRRYRSTVHVIANHRADVDGASATAVTSCFAHHLEGEVGAGVDRILAIRYRDRLVRAGAGWRFARRELHVLWTEHRPVEA